MQFSAQKAEFPDCNITEVHVMDSDKKGIKELWYKWKCELPFVDPTQCLKGIYKSNTAIWNGTHKIDWV